MLFGHEKITFTTGCTPMEYLPNMSKELGIELYIKRDDMTNLGMGGNKLRKLEYLLKDAQDKKATMLLTLGGAQTNHGRLTAAVAAKYGMKCVIICIDEYPGQLSANLLLDRLMGAEVILKKSDGRDENLQFEELAAQVKAKYEALGEVVYEIPIGGSNVIGALGYYDAAVEITQQAQEMGISDATVVLGAGSLGTYMGMYLGLRNENSPLKLCGIAISPFKEAKEKRIMEYAAQCESAFNLPFKTKREDMHIETAYVREGYNVPNAAVRRAIYLMAQKEAIILDPCYTGKAFAGLLDMVAEGKIKKGERVIFLHTGGQPAITTPFHRTELEKELIDGIVQM